MADTDPLGAQQLSALAEVGSLLDRSGLEYWLFGGWSEELLGADERDLLGVRSRVRPLTLLERGKSSARDDPDDAAKDRADFQALSALSR